jgi:ABC-type antimicrobial peptide transport system permease subunit
MYLFNTTNIFGLETVDLTVYSIAIGVFFAFFAYWFLQNIVGKLVRRIAKRAVGEENAKTLEELDRSNALYRFLLRDGSTLRRMISCVGDTLPTSGEKGKADFTQAKFFVTEDNAKKALHRYPRKISPWWLVLVFALAAGISFGATYLVPIILDLFSK